MLRRNSSDEDYLRLERRLRDDGFGGMLRLYRHAERVSDNLTAARIKVLRSLHKAGFSYPDPEVLALMTGRERELALFVLRGGDRRFFQFSHRFGFPERSVDGGDAVVFERIGGPSNRDQYLGRAGLERAMSEAAAREREWGPLVLPQRLAWGKPSPRGYVEWIVDHSLFLTPTGYGYRYLHYVGQHSLRSNEEKGVQSLDYQFREAHFEDNSFTPTPETIREEEAVFDGQVTQFELAILDLIQRVNRSAEVGRGSHHQDVIEVLRRLVAREDGSELGASLKKTDFMVSPSHAPTARWRERGGLSSFGFVLGVRPANKDYVVLGVAMDTLLRQQTLIRPDHVWSVLEPWPGRSAAALTRRLLAWAEEPDDRKLVVPIAIARAWIKKVRDLFWRDYP